MAVFVIILSAIMAFTNNFFEFGKHVKGEKVEPSPSLPPDLPEPSQRIFAPLKEAQLSQENIQPCKGKKFNIIQDLDNVQGKEIPFQVDPVDPSVVSASGSANFQVTKRYPFLCDPPWVATFSFTPKKEFSVGVFFEYEDVFKITIGDGDRLTWLLQKNDQGSRRKDWTEVSKEKLVKGKIAIDREVTGEVTMQKIEGNQITLKLKLRYQPENSSTYEWVEYIKSFKPEAADLIGNPARSVRIGLNDSRFKGEGTEVKFGYFSIRELK